jgi:alpha/beta superfamily hydrolase
MDIVMRNKRRKHIECSFYKLKDQKEVLPVVVYLHGNSSSRLSALQYLEHLLPEVNVFTVDMSGSGRSEGEYVSLGYHEKEDVRAVVRYLRE